MSIILDIPFVYAARFAVRGGRDTKIAMIADNTAARVEEASTGEAEIAAVLVCGETSIAYRNVGGILYRPAPGPEFLIDNDDGGYPRLAMPRRGEGPHVLLMAWRAALLAPDARHLHWSPSRRWKQSARADRNLKAHRWIGDNRDSKSAEIRREAQTDWLVIDGDLHVRSSGPWFSVEAGRNPSVRVEPEAGWTTDPMAFVAAASRRHFHAFAAADGRSSEICAGPPGFGAGGSISVIQPMQTLVDPSLTLRSAVARSLMETLSRPSDAGPELLRESAALFGVAEMEAGALDDAARRYLSNLEARGLHSAHLVRHYTRAAGFLKPGQVSLDEAESVCSGFPAPSGR